jgi:hypothetical protein
MSQLFIDFQCNLSPLFRDVLGSRGFAFVVQDGFLGLGQLTLYSHFCPLFRPVSCSPQANQGCSPAALGSFFDPAPLP